MESVNLFWGHTSSSDIIAISAAFIALCSGCIALWQGWLMRRHNVLSVTPHIDISCNLVIGQPISLSIGNHGIGPAIVRELSYAKLDGSKITLSSYDAYKSALSDMGIELDDFAHIVRDFPDNTPIGVGKDFEFITFPDSESDSSQNRFLSKKLESAKIEIFYECIYGRSFRAFSHK